MTKKESGISQYMKNLTGVNPGKKDTPISAPVPATGPVAVEKVADMDISQHSAHSTQQSVSVAFVDHNDRPSSVTTAVRVRPPSAAELRNESRCITSVEGGENAEERSLNLLDPTFFSRKREYDQKYFERQFKYDFCFWQNSSQQLVYEKVGEPLLQHALDGFNCCILAYGQTGSGKTYTMVGDDNDSMWAGLGSGKGPAELAGVIPRLCHGLLAAVRASIGIDTHKSSLSSETDHTHSRGHDGYQLLDATISASFYEIYNEKVHDLLSAKPEAPCRVREHPEEGAYIDHLSMSPIENMAQAAQVMMHGLKQRAVAETRMNAMSSRSHAVFTLYIRQKLAHKEKGDKHESGSGKDKDKDSGFIQRNSKITLVDLAGSERVSLTGATGERLVEANNINKSLSTLSDVIKALSDKGASLVKEEQSLALSLTPSKRSTVDDFFVPYRNSVLTWLLKDCLGGNARTSMLANVGPSENSYNETMSTLRYIERAKLIMNAARINETSTDPAFVLNLQKQIALLRGRIVDINKQHALKEEKHRMELIQMEEDLEKRFIAQNIELKDELYYYKTSQKTSSAPGSPSRAAGSSSSSTSNAEVTLLTTELAQSKSLLEQQAAIIAQYEDSEGIVAGNPAPNRMKGIVLSYKKEKDILGQQYEEVMHKCRTLTHDLESARDHMDQIEFQKNSMMADLSLARADRNRLKSELVHRVEEINTKVSELEFYKSRLTSSVGEHKRKITLLEMHISKAKDSESLMRHEREADMDKFTELLAEKQRQIQEVDVRIAEGAAVWAEKNEILDAKLKQSVKEKDRLRHQVQGKSEELDVSVLEIDKLKEEVARLKEKELALKKCEKDLEESHMESKRKQSTLAALRTDFDEHKTLLLSEQKKLTEAYNQLGATKDTKDRLEKDVNDLETALAAKQEEMESEARRRGKQFLDMQSAHELALAKAAEKITDLNDKLRDRIKETQQLDAEIKRWKELELSKEQELKLAQDKDAQMQKDIKALQNEVKIEKEHEHDLEERLHTEEEVEQKLKDSLERTAAELVSEHSIFVAMQATLEATANSLAAAQEKEQKLRESVEFLSSALAVKEAAFTSTKELLDATEIKLEETRKHLNVSITKENQSSKHKFELGTKLASEQEAHHLAQTNADSLQASLTATSAELKATQAAHGDLEKEVRRLGGLVQDGDSLIKTMVAKHEVEASELKSLKKKLESEHKQLEDYMSGASESQNRMAMFRQQLDDQETKFEDLTNEYEQVMERLKTANTQLEADNSAYKHLEADNRKLERLVQDNDNVVKHMIGKQEDEHHELEALRKRVAREDRERELSGGANSEVMLNMLREQVVDAEERIVALEAENATLLESKKALSKNNAQNAEITTLRKNLDDTNAKLQEYAAKLQTGEARILDKDAQLVVKDATIAELHTRLKSASASNSHVANASAGSGASTAASTPGSSPEKKKKRSSIFSGAKKGWNVIRGLAGVESKKGEGLPPPLPEVVETDPAELRIMVENLQTELAERDAELLEVKMGSSSTKESTFKHESRYFKPMMGKAQQWKGVHSMVRWASLENMAKLKDMLKEKPDILKLQDPRSLNVILHIAAQNGHEVTTRMLLDAGADCNVKNCTGQTPLHMAMAYDYAEVVKMLRAAGAQDTIRNDNGFTAISGIDGDKTTGLLSLNQADSSKSIYLALDEISTQVSTTDVAEYVKIYLESKRERGEAWGKREIKRFKEVFEMLGVVPVPQPQTYVEEKDAAVADTSKENEALREQLADAVAAVEKAQKELQASLSSTSDEKEKLMQVTAELAAVNAEKALLEETSEKASRVAQEASDKLSDHAAEVKQLKAELSALKSQLIARRSPLPSPSRRKLTGAGGLDADTHSPDGKSVSAAGDGKGPDGVNESVLVGEHDEYTYYTHDDASLTEELIMTKMTLALTNSELEQLQFDFKASARTVDELKELVDVLREDLSKKARGTIS